MNKTLRNISILFVFAFRIVSKVEAHGYVQTPRSRNWVAAEDGVWWGGTDDLPAKENCPSCANTKTTNGFCGIVDSRDYDNPLDSIGHPLPPKVQAVYTEGQTIDMEFVFTANHNGHHQTYACANFENPTKECFQQNPLEFVEDITMQAYGTDANALKDPNYPNRGYVNPNASHTRMRFKLPEGVTGDLVLLQWHWVTGNSCRSAGYDDYDYPSGWEPNNMGPCPDYDNLSPIGAGQPEQFWNCIEVKITKDGSTGPTTSINTSSPTKSPINSPREPSPSPTTSSPTTVSPMTPTTSSPVIPNGNGCCSLNFKDCDASWCGDTEAQCLSCGSPGDKVWLPNGPVTECIARWGTCTNDVDGCCSSAACIGDQWYKQCLPDPNETPSTPTSNSPTPPLITLSPIQPTTPSPVPPGSKTLFSTTSTRSSYDALLALDPITNIIQASDPPIWAIVAEGGAAGSGNVISEGQGYALMISGITLASIDPSDTNRQDAMKRFYGYFYGWKRMCQNSAPKAWCQNEKLCDGGTTPCLPGWKHDEDLTTVIGAGAAPDGDQDAIVGMIFALKAVENEATKPSWYDEVRKWADASATSFLFHNTKPSKTGNENRIVKLGTCWGGWETEGQNPSYHSPGSYRLMKDFQVDFPSADRDYNMPNFDDGTTLETRWTRVIDTSYDFLNAAKCDDMGLVPNWAMATESISGDIELYPGSFSGSGTPQYEFGSEASRTIWRVLFDVVMYPDEAYDNAKNFLQPLQTRLVNGYSPNSGGWSTNTLEPCDGVDTVFPFWQSNSFIYSPVYSALALQAGSVDTVTQQNMVDTAGMLVDNIPENLSYFSRCWAIIGIITLNGDVAKAMHQNPTSSPTTSPNAVTSSPTSSPIAATGSPTSSPIAATGSPISPPLCNSRKTNLEIHYNGDAMPDGDETYFKLFMFKANGKKKLLKKKYFLPNKFKKYKRCLITKKCYELIVVDKNKDGICCEHGNGFYKLNYDGITINESFENGARRKHKFGQNCPISKTNNDEGQNYFIEANDGEDMTLSSIDDNSYYDDDRSMNVPPETLSFPQNFRTYERISKLIEKLLDFMS